MSPPVTVIEARPRSVWARLGALWKQRAFIPFLAREIAMKKFRGTVLGFWWLIVRPLLPTAIAVFVFTQIVPLTTPVPYALFYLCGFLVWNAMAAAVVFMPRTLLWMSGIMRKTYFPRLLIPIAAMGVALIEFLVVAVILLIVIGAYWIGTGDAYVVLDLQTLWLIPAIAIALCLGFAIGMASSVIAVFVRDIVFSMGYFTQAWFFVTPLLYPLTTLPAPMQPYFLALNPMTAPLETARWALFRTGELPAFWLGVSAIETGIILLLSIAFFLRAETRLADAM